MKILRFLVPILVLVSTAIAMDVPLGPEWDNTTLGKLSYAYEAGRLTYEQFLMYRVIAMHAGNSYVPTQYLGERFCPGTMSGTPIMEELRFNWSKLSAEQKELIRKATGFNGYDTNPNGISYRFDWDGEYHYYDSPEGNVRIHYETTGQHATTAALAQAYAAQLEIAYQRNTAAGAPPLSFGSGYERDDSPKAGQRINDGGMNPLRDAYNSTGETPNSYYPEGADFGFGPGGNPQGDNRYDMYIRLMASGVGAYTQYEHQDPKTVRYAYGHFYAFPPVGGTPDLGTTLHESSHGMFQGFYDVTDEPWYKEATSTWAEDEMWNHPDPYTTGNCELYLSKPWLPLDYWVVPLSTDCGYRCCLWNFFITDYGKQRATPGSKAAEGLYNFWMVRRVWEAMANHDYWYSNKEGVNRNTFQGMDFAFDYYDQPMTDYVSEYAMLKEWFANFTMWNWFTGSHDDGNHYRWGSLWSSGPDITWTYDTYPVDDAPYTHGTTAAKKPSHLSSNYFTFTSIPAGWSGMTIKFTNDDTNPVTSEEWRGWYFTPSGSTWTAHPMHTPKDGICRVDFTGGVPSMVGICIANVAMTGTALSYHISADESTDATPPDVALALARPDHNPSQLEVVVGSNKDLFGPAVGYGEFTYSGSHTNTDPNVYPDANTFHTGITTTVSSNNRTAQGVYTMPGQNGTGTVHVEVADNAGNIVTKDKDYSANTLNTIGGDLTLEKCKLTVPSGALSESTWFTIVADPDLAAAANHAAMKRQGTVSATSEQFYGNAYIVQPSWASLKKDMTLALSYSDYSVDETKIAVQRLEGTTVKNIGGIVDRLHQRVVANIDRPGTYILGLGKNDGFGDGGSMPLSFFLGQNYPNPVTKNTTIRYSIGSAKTASIKIYALNGALVRTLYDGPSQLGEQSITWDGKDSIGKKVAAGVYLYTLNADGQTATRKMVIAH